MRQGVETRMWRRIERREAVVNEAGSDGGTFDVVDWYICDEWRVVRGGTTDK